MTLSRPTPEMFDVPVSGGALRAVRWPGDGPVVLAAHGITANALAWAQVGAALRGRATLVAVDLRGRAASAGLPGPYGLRAHVDDLVAVLDHLGVPRAALAGHSMGAFVAALAAVRRPDRFSSVLLVDGGVALTVPEAGDIDAILHAVIGPAMQRLQMTFDSPGAYLDYWRAHPALARDWSPELERYLLRDLVGDPPALRSSCLIEAVRADATDTLRDEQTVTAVHRLTCPATLLWAARGMFDEPQGLYDEARLARAGLDRARIAVERVEDANHYTVLMSPHGAARVAEHLARLG